MWMKSTIGHYSFAVPLTCPVPEPSSTDSEACIYKVSNNSGVLNKAGCLYSKLDSEGHVRSAVYSEEGLLARVVSSNVLMQY